MTHQLVLGYWKLKQYNLPHLAMMVCDILAVLATTVDIEKLFNQAHDICHYHCGRLGAESIRASMMVKIFDRIELLDKLEMIQENDPFIDLQYNNCKIEREDPVSYISNDNKDDDNFLCTKILNRKTTLS